MSIKSKINLSFLVLGIVAALAIALFNYVEIKNDVIDNAFKKAELINSFAMASRTYTVKTMRPLAQKGSLQCHGKHEEAPKGRRSLYPGPGGYNSNANDIVAAFITYVPVEKALAEVNASTLKIAFTGIGLIMVIFVIVWLLIDRIVTKPIVALTGMSDQVSRGKGLETILAIASQDEIGDLFQSFDRMRKSVVKLIRMVKR